ncbi:hypothetical protein [Schleiferilactobacillus perolens]|uniref:Type VII secretion protein EssA n=1 Tax=Schleiferilactobacillus perolens DSM 12744 TaxID=1423792 RepID=A0A0R1MJE0_9LACO|nr:hypothetical protein [Schleiferilactobacillus perolens]KRL08060.1 hypothetical protein FD09_GL001706 [Schleiferilactobacillus perolens DSM 12744]
MRKRLSQWLWVIVLVGGIVSGMHTSVQATDGNLDIDNTPIYHNAKAESENSIYTVAPDLFLPKVTQIEQKNARTNTLAADKVVRQVFTGKAKQPVAKSLVSLNQLFTKRWQQGNTRANAALSSGDQDYWPLLWPIIIVGGVLLTLLGVYLGKRFSTIIKEKGETS